MREEVEDLVLGEAAADGAGLLGAEIEGDVLLVLVGVPERSLLLLRDDGEHPSDGQPDHLDLR